MERRNRTHDIHPAVRGKYHAPVVPHDAFARTEISRQDVRKTNIILERGKERDTQKQTDERTDEQTEAGQRQDSGERESPRPPVVYNQTLSLARRQISVMQSDTETFAAQFVGKVLSTTNGRSFNLQRDFPLKTS